MGKYHKVWDGGAVRPAFPAGRLELSTRGQKNRVAVGDRVVLGRREDETLLIEAVLPRTNKISRRITFTGAEHVVAANVDVMAVMLAPTPTLNVALLDRYLAAAEHAGVAPLIVINKMDILEAGEAEEALAPYRALGYPAVLMAAKRDVGLSEFLGAVSGRWVLIVGHSGVGKTTLVNHAVPGADEAVREVHEARGKGRHTTSSAIAHPLPGGTTLVDTAGIREFALWAMDWRAIAAAFPEIAEASQKCRFPDCRHRSEPACAVRNAVETDAVNAARYASYLTLVNETEDAGRAKG